MISHDRWRATATMAIALTALVLGGRPATAQISGLPATTSEFILNNAYQKNVDNLGAVAVGGNAFFPDYGIGNTGGATNALVVGGNLTASFATISGNVIVGGLATYTDPSITGSLSGGMGISLNPTPSGGTITGLAIHPSGQPYTNNGVTVGPGGSGNAGTVGAVTVPINFSSEGALLNQISAAQVAASDYSVAPIYVNQLHFNLSSYTPQSGSTYYFDVTAANWERSGTGVYIDATHAVANASVVINILNPVGGTVTAGPTNFTLTGIGTGNILYNFSGETSVTLNNGVDGSVLAPNANILWTTGDINGQLIAGSIGSPTAYSGVEIHYSPFSGTLRPVPEPASLALMGAGGLGLLGYSWRRRRARRAA